MSEGGGAGKNESAGSFGRGLATLVSGTSSGQVILLLAAPILTRIYEPSDFGQLAVFTAFLSILGVIVSLRYQLAIPLPATDNEAFHVASVAIVCAVLVSLGVGVVVYVLGDKLAVLVNIPPKNHPFWALPIALFIAGLYGIAVTWSIRRQNYRAIARAKIVQPLFTASIQLGIQWLGPIALILGQIAGYGAGGVIIFAYLKRELRFENICLQSRGMFLAAKRYRKFPLFSTWGALLNTASLHLMPIILAKFFGVAAVGYYFLAERVLSSPAALIGESISQIFLGHASVARRDGQLKALVAQLARILIDIACPILVGLFLVSPPLFAVLFGDDWGQAGDIARWLAVGVLFQFVASPLSLLFIVLERQGAEILLQAALLISRVLAIWIGIALDSLLWAAVFYGTVSAANYIVVILWAFRQLGIPAMATIEHFCTQVILGLVLAIPLWTANLFFIEEKAVFWSLSFLYLGALLMRYKTVYHNVMRAGA